MCEAGVLIMVEVCYQWQMWQDLQGQQGAELKASNDHRPEEEKREVKASAGNSGAATHNCSGLDFTSTPLVVSYKGNSLSTYNPMLPSQINRIASLPGSKLTRAKCTLRTSKETKCWMGNRWERSIFMCLHIEIIITNLTQVQMHIIILPFPGTSG